MDRYIDRDPTPIASLGLDCVALNTAIQELRQAQLGEAIKTLALQARINRLQGALSDLTQRLELKAGKTKAGTPREEVPA